MKLSTVVSPFILTFKKSTQNVKKNFNMKAILTIMALASYTSFAVRGPTSYAITYLQPFLFLVLCIVYALAALSSN
mgnify:CR=1 FL=1